MDKKMTVSDLIRIMEQYPPDMPVYVSDNDAVWFLKPHFIKETTDFETNGVRISVPFTKRDG